MVEDAGMDFSNGSERRMALYDSVLGGKVVSGLALSGYHVMCQGGMLSLTT